MIARFGIVFSAATLLLAHFAMNRSEETDSLFVLALIMLLAATLRR